MTTNKMGCAIIGSGNIGTDLMVKILKQSQHLELLAMVGIDPNSDGLARASRMGVFTTHEGLTGLMSAPCYENVRIIFDATSAKAHVAHAKRAFDGGPAQRRPRRWPAASCSPRSWRSGSRVYYLPLSWRSRLVMYSGFSGLRYGPLRARWPGASSVTG